MARLSMLRLFYVLAFGFHAAALNPIVIKGNQFIDSITKERFVMVGLAYQPKGESGYDFRSGRDTLTDPDTCLRDAIVMQNLGINTIRVYNLNPDLNHDECASIFNAAGIYMALDVNSPFPGESINRYNPQESYQKGYISRLAAVVEAFKNYPNLLLFFAGNEVVNDSRSSRVSPPYMRAVQRDLKQYIRTHSNRTIPVGYSASDDKLRRVMHQYLTCGEDDDSKADFFGLNSYEWCHGANWDTSGYQKLVDNFANTPVPIFFSEYGCNLHRPRSFTEIPVLYGERMVDNWGGGIVYEYSEERSQYGLVQIQKNGDVALGKEYDNLRTQYHKLDFAKINSHPPVFRQNPPCNEDLIMGDYTEGKFNASFVFPVCPAPELLLKNRTSTAVPKNVGKLVEVVETRSRFKVFSSGGTEIADLELKQVEGNTPNRPAGNSSNSGLDPFDPTRENNGKVTNFLPSSSLGILVTLVYLFLL